MEYTCEMCGQTARNPQGLSAHKRAKHGVEGKTRKRVDPVEAFLAKAFPKGIPVNKRHAVTEWEEATQRLLS